MNALELCNNCEARNAAPGSACGYCAECSAEAASEAWESRGTAPECPEALPELLGYRVARGGKRAPTGAMPRYTLTGKRGAEYRLVPHGGGERETMYAINGRGNIVGLHGNYTFADFTNGSRSGLRCWYEGAETVARVTAAARERGAATL